MTPSPSLTTYLRPYRHPFTYAWLWIVEIVTLLTILLMYLSGSMYVDALFFLLVLGIQCISLSIMHVWWKKQEDERRFSLESALLQMDASWEVVRGLVSSDEDTALLYQAFTKAHFEQPEHKAPILQRGSDEKGPTWGKEDDHPDAPLKRRDAYETSHIYDGMEGPLSVGEVIVEEANQRYAEEAQLRWEHSEKNDPDLVEAGVERLGDLLRTGWFERNAEDGAFEKLTKNEDNAL